MNAHEDDGDYHIGLPHIGTFRVRVRNGRIMSDSTNLMAQWHTGTTIGHFREWVRRKCGGMTKLPEEPKP